MSEGDLAHTPRHSPATTLNPDAARPRSGPCTPGAGLQRYSDEAIHTASQLLRCAGIFETIHCTKSDTLRVWNHTRPGPVKSVTSPSPPRIDDFHPPAFRTPYRTDSSNATT